MNLIFLIQKLVSKQSFLGYSGEAGGGLKIFGLNILLSFLYLFLTIIGGGLLGNPPFEEMLWYDWLYFWILPLVGVSLIILIVWGAVTLYNSIPRPYVNSENSPQFIKIAKEGVSNWYNKMCTRIDWK